MAQIWEQNEQKSEEEELVVTEHRDEDGPLVLDDDAEEVETPEGQTAQDALRALGEDVSSSPARRGQDNPAEEPGHGNAQP